MNTFIFSIITINTDQLTIVHRLSRHKEMGEIFVVYSCYSQNINVPLFEVWKNKVKLENTFQKEQMWTKLHRSKLRALRDARKRLTPLVSGSSWFKSNELQPLLFCSKQYEVLRMACCRWQIFCKTIHSSYSSVNPGWDYWSINKCLKFCE